MNTRILLLGCCALAGLTTGCPGPEGGTVDAFVAVDAGLRPGDGGRDMGVPRDMGPPRDTGADAFVAVDAFGPRDAFVGPDAFAPDAFAPDAFVADAFVPMDAGPCAVCSDGNLCNGAETCDVATGTCNPPGSGTPLDCDDGMACTADSCAPATGCMSTPIDTDLDGDSDCTDCAPTDRLIFHGATEICNMLDDNCNGSTDEGVVMPLFADCDGDGWATETAVTFDSCPPPPVTDTGCGTAEQAWTPRVASATDFDCADEDARAHSTTTTYHTTPIAGAFPDVDFDFNCDFIEDPQFAVQGSCVRVAPGGACTTTPGWLLPVVPECGASATYIAGCTALCVGSTELRTQACR